ncbi:hypothetical protein QVD99_008615 [Batrachochytrium dendrobatidis]|nr:hypothetical protein O5D80_001291 [Batrachochytrium dendrobatidis]KAK5664552.1 hypothetical protein QVD99_008615 [Batrachochytrium dendrobatidis]
MNCIIQTCRSFYVGLRLSWMQRLVLSISLFVVSQHPSQLLHHIGFHIATSYLITWLLYLFNAQKNNRKRWNVLGVQLPYVPIDPFKVSLITFAFYEMLGDYLVGAYIPIGIKLLHESRLRRELKRIGSDGMIDISYGGRNHVTLDVYANVYNGAKHKLDLKQYDKGFPVIVFVYGGGWCSGDKNLYAPLARTLNRLGYIVVVPNYSLWPIGSMDDMVHDVGCAIKWTFKHIESYGGNVDRVSVMAHSAGAHLSVLAMIRNAEKLSFSNSVKNEDSCDALSRVYSMIMISGPYDISDHLVFESSRGIDEVSCMARLLDNDYNKFHQASPSQIDHLFTTTQLKLILKWLPTNWLIIHGQYDAVVPFTSSMKLYNALKNVGVDHIFLKTYTHIGHAKIIFDLMLPKQEVELEDELNWFFGMCASVEAFKTRHE